jgi:hypothetical protein
MRPPSISEFCVQTNEAEPPRSNTTEEKLLALKAEYLAAHSSYQTYLALCATAELENSRSSSELQTELEQALNNLNRARNEYRRVLFEIAFRTDVSLN